MILFLVILVCLWAALLIAGFLVKGLIWLAWVAMALLVLTALISRVFHMMSGVERDRHGHSDQWEQTAGSKQTIGRNLWS